jgi:hypothetical protein
MIMTRNLISETVQLVRIWLVPLYLQQKQKSLDMDPKQ